MQPYLVCQRRAGNCIFNRENQDENRCSEAGNWFHRLSLGELEAFTASDTVLKCSSVFANEAG